MLRRRTVLKAGAAAAFVPAAPARWNGKIWDLFGDVIEDAST